MSEYEINTLKSVPLPQLINLPLKTFIEFYERMNIKLDYKAFKLLININQSI